MAVHAPLLTYDERHAFQLGTLAPKTIWRGSEQ